MQNSRPFYFLFCFLACSLLLTSCQASADWKTLEKQADELKQNGKKPDAIKYYILAVKQMEQSELGTKEQIACINKLVQLLLEQNQAKEADKYATKALSMAERLYGPDHINVMPQVVLVQRACSNIPDRDRVAECLERLVDLQTKHSGPESPPVMWLLDQYARSKSAACGKKMDPQKLRQLVHLREKFAKKDDLDTTRDRLILATCLYQTGENKEACEIYQSCLTLARAKFQGLLPELLLGYSKALIKQKENEKAIPLLQEAFSIAGPGEHYNSGLAPEIATELGFLLQEKKEKAEARKVYESMLNRMSAEKNSKAEYFKAQLSTL